MIKKLCCLSNAVVIVLLVSLCSCSSLNEERNEAEIEIVASSIMNDTIAMQMATNSSDAYVHPEPYPDGGFVGFDVWEWKPRSWKDLRERYSGRFYDTTSYKSELPDINGVMLDCENPPHILYSPVASYKTDSTHVIFFNMGLGYGNEGDYCEKLRNERGYIGAAAYKKTKEGWVLSKRVFDFIPMAKIGLGDIYSCYFGDAGNIAGSPAVVIYINNKESDSYDDFESRFYDYGLNMINRDHADVVLFKHEIDVNNYFQPLPSKSLRTIARDVYETFKNKTKATLPPFEDVSPIFTTSRSRYTGITYYKHYARYSDHLEKDTILLKGEINIYNLGKDDEKVYYDGIWYNYHDGLAHNLNNKLLNQSVVDIADVDILYDNIRDEESRSYNTRQTYLTDGQKCSLCSVGRYVSGTCNMCGTVSSEKESKYLDDFRSDHEDSPCRFCQGTGRISGGECAQCLGTGVSPRIY
ncbi:hypothetical protein ACFS7Z_08740 [Pontibacter toksunensis]|uniref:Uncharacterized protein n=1 Tax=Pontibacter toksunensis TaxID=1332631 RepID=A0ABW6BRI2_9BACT